VDPARRHLAREATARGHRHVGQAWRTAAYGIVIAIRLGLFGLGVHVVAAAISEPGATLALGMSTRR
jgi:hypothetical protein